MYPVSVAADPTTGKHYYVALLASGGSKEEGRGEGYGEGGALQRVDPTVGAGGGERTCTTNDDANDAPMGYYSSPVGGPNYGTKYRVVIKK